MFTHNIHLKLQDTTNLIPEVFIEKKNLRNCIVYKLKNPKTGAAVH